VHVGATNFGERLAGCRDLADRMHELARALPGRSTEQLAITDGRAVARGECRLGGITAMGIRSGTPPWRSKRASTNQPSPLAWPGPTQVSMKSRKVTSPASSGRRLVTSIDQVGT